MSLRGRKASTAVPQVSARGFLHFAPVPSEYGGHVTAYESSAASGPHVWLRITCPEDLNNPTGPEIEAVAHLTLANAVELRNQLTHLIRHLR